MLPKYTIMNKVCSELSIRPSELLSKKRYKKASKSRLIFWAALRSAGYSYPSIAEYTYRDRSTVSYLLKVADPEYLARGREIYESLKKVKVDNLAEQYPELYEVETVRVPDYHQNKIVELQRVVKKF